MLVLKSNTYTKGFSIIEIMISIVIATIIMAIAAPSFKTLIHNRNIRTSAEAIHSGLQLARMEAVRRNTSTRFALGGTSTTAWSVVVDSDSSNIQSRPVGEYGGSVTNLTLTPAGAVTVTFNRLGRVIDNTDSSETLTQIELDVPTSILTAAQSRELQVNISSGGQIRLCNPLLPNTNPQGC